LRKAVIAGLRHRDKGRAGPSLKVGVYMYVSCPASTAQALRGIPGRAIQGPLAAGLPFSSESSGVRFSESDGVRETKTRSVREKRRERAGRPEGKARSEKGRWYRRSVVCRSKSPRRATWAGGAEPLARAVFEGPLLALPRPPSGGFLVCRAEGIFQRREGTRGLPVPRRGSAPPAGIREGLSRVAGAQEVPAVAAERGLPRRAGSIAAGTLGDARTGGEIIFEPGEPFFAQLGPVALKGRWD